MAEQNRQKSKSVREKTTVTTLGRMCVKNNVAIQVGASGRVHTVAPGLWSRQDMYDNQAIFRLHACSETFAFCKLGVEEPHVRDMTLCPDYHAININSLLCGIHVLYVLYHTAGHVSSSAELFFYHTKIIFMTPIPAANCPIPFLSIGIFAFFSSMFSRGAVDLFKLQRRYMYYCC